MIGFIAFGILSLASTGYSIYNCKNIYQEFYNNKIDDSQDIFTNIEIDEN